MALLVFDTHDFITKLSESGMDPAQAKAVSDGLRTINLEHVATKEDLGDIHSEIEKLHREMLQMKSSLLQWFTGMLIGQAALVAALVKLL